MAFIDLKRKLRQASRDYRQQWTMVCIIAGAVLLFFTFIPVFNIEVMEVSVIKGFHDAIGYWVYWLFVLAIIVLLVGVGYYYGHMKRLKEFYELMDTESKAQFVRNKTDAEYLGWRLGKEYEDMVAEKKASFRIKK